MHAHDRTLLASFGFQDPDKKERRHDLACQYLAVKENHQQLARLVTEPVWKKAKKTEESWRQYQDALTGEYHSNVGYKFSRSFDNISAHKPQFERLISKGEGKYKTTIGFLDLVLPFGYIEVLRGKMDSHVASYHDVRLDSAQRLRDALNRSAWRISTQDNHLAASLPAELRARVVCDVREQDGLFVATCYTLDPSGGTEDILARVEHGSFFARKAEQLGRLSIHALRIEHKNSELYREASFPASVATNGVADISGGACFSVTVPRLTSHEAVLDPLAWDRSNVSSDGKVKLTRDDLPLDFRDHFPKNGAEMTVRSEEGALIAAVAQFKRGWADHTEETKHSQEIAVEVKITPVGAGEIMRQISLYREHTEYRYWVAATAFPMSKADVESMAMEGITHVRLGQKFDKWCAQQQSVAENDDSPEL